MRLLAATLALTLASCSASAVELQEGDVVVADVLAGLLERPTTNTGRILAVDPAGDLLLSRSPGDLVWDVSWHPREARVVFTTTPLIGSEGSAIGAFDPVSGSLRVLCSGGPLQRPLGVVVSASGRIFAANPGIDPLGGGGEAPGGLVECDPSAGATSVWTGTVSDQPGAVAVEPDGSLLYTDGELEGGTGAIYRVDPDQGTREQVARGGLLVDPLGIASDPECGTFVADVETLGGTGRLLELGSEGVSQVFRGAPLVDPFGVAIEPAPDCGVIVSNADLEAALDASMANPVSPDFSGVPRQLLRFDPGSPGESPEVVASGEPLLLPYGVTLVPEPDVGAQRFAALAALAALAVRGGRRRTGPRAPRLV